MLLLLLLLLLLYDVLFRDRLPGLGRGRRNGKHTILHMCYYCYVLCYALYHYYCYVLCYVYSYHCYVLCYVMLLLLRVMLCYSYYIRHTAMCYVMHFITDFITLYIYIYYVIMFITSERETRGVCPQSRYLLSKVIPLKLQ